MIYQRFGKFKEVLLFCLNQNSFSHCLSVLCGEIGMNVDVCSDMFSDFNVTDGGGQHMHKDV